MNVTLYAICKNEEKNIEKFINNSKKFYHTVVVDTGSTDNTVQLLRDAGIEVYEHPQTREEFDFSVARNQALSYVKTDWAFVLDFNEDVDEFYPEGFDAISKEFTAFKHLRYDDNGTDEPVQSNEVHIRFHRTKNYTWVNAVHEVPNFFPTEEYPNESSVNTTIKITKKINKTIDKEIFYFTICEREHKKDPTNWYWIWFIFNHYYNVRNFQKALEYGQEFLNVSKPYFDSFRILAFIRCSQILFSMGDTQRGMNYAFHGVSEGMNMGGMQLTQAFSYFFEVSKKYNDPNLIIFATAFNPDMAYSAERQEAIDRLFLTNLNDTPSCWMGHRKFAEWLVTYTKPEVIVDLGVDKGFSTFCFAMPRIGHVYGIDTFEGDEYTGPTPGSYEHVLYKQEKLFMKQNTTFIKGYFDEVAKTWDKPIDILHIDGDHAYESVKNDYETWSPFLKENGVILFHDTCVEDLNGHEYGVKKFFGELDLPKVTFTHTFGLGVASKNKEIIEFIKNNFDLDNPL
jgi:glycosyltransferase involved in cell wall biosynthesis